MSDPQQARQYFYQSAELYEVLGDEARMAESYLNMGLTAWITGDLGSALDLSERSLALSNKLAIHAIPALALSEAEAGNVERAVELDALASRYAYISNSRWFEMVARRHVASLATGLAPETASVAQARGQSMDFWKAVRQWLDKIQSCQAPG